VREIRSWPKREIEQGLADLMIDLARQAGQRYDADRETPPRVDDTFHRAIWRVYLATRDARVNRAIGEQAARHTR
jgi:hypothetical protein